MFKTMTITNKYLKIKRDMKLIQVTHFDNMMWNKFELILVK